MLVGVTGYAQSGKDEFAKSLALRGGFVRFGMSDALHDMAMVLDPILIVEGTGEEGSYTKLARYSGLTEVYGYDAAKEFPEYRGFLQRLGTEAVREIIGEDSWERAAERRFYPYLSEGKNVVVTGIRFPNEAQMIKRYAGTIVRIEREGYGPINAHASDTLDNINADVLVFNNGSLNDLAQEATKLLRTWGV